MRCPACGVECVAEAIFCHKCGQRLVEQDAKSAQPAPASSDPSTSIEKFKAAAAQTQTGNEQERELWSGNFSSKAMIGAWCVSAAVSIVLLLIGVFWIGFKDPWLWMILLLVIIATWGYNLARLVYRRLGVHYLLTNQRFIHETGILRRVTDRIEVIDIDDITFEQGVIERMMNVGTIKIASSDRSHPEIFLLGIEKVREVSGLIDDTRRDERRRRGLHIESI